MTIKRRRNSDGMIKCVHREENLQRLEGNHDSQIRPKGLEACCKLISCKYLHDSRLHDSKRQKSILTQV